MVARRHRRPSCSALHYDAAVRLRRPGTADDPDGERRTGATWSPADFVTTTDGHGHRPPRPRLRCRRHGGRPAAGPARPQPGRPARAVRRPRRPWAGDVRQGRRRGDRRGRPRRARACCCAPTTLHPHLPVLLALQAAADLLREALLVHPHDRRCATSCWPTTPTIDWHPEHIRDGRFGNWLENNVDWALSRDRYWGTPLPFWRCDDCDHVTVVSSRARPVGAAPASDHRDLDPHRPYVDDVDGAVRGLRRDGAPRPRRGRRLVRLGRDAVRPVGLPAHGRRGVPAPLPRRLHLRGDRPDPRLVLHAARRVDAAVRRQLLPGLRLPRPHRGRGRPQDVQVGRQHPRPVGADRPPRRRRAALADAGRGQPVGVAPGRPPAARGHRPAVPADAVEHPRVLHHLRPARRVRPRPTPAVPARRRPAGVGPVGAGRAGRPRRHRRRLARAVRRLHLDAPAGTLRRRPVELVRAPRSPPVLEGAAEDDRADKLAAYATLHTCLSTVAQLLAPFTPFLADRLWQDLVVSQDPDAPASVHLTDFPVAGRGLARRRPAGGDGHDPPRRRARPPGPDRRGREGPPAAGPGARHGARRRSAPAWPSCVAEVADELNVKAVELSDGTGDLVERSLKPNFRALGPAFQKRAPPVATRAAGARPEAAAGVARRRWTPTGQDATLEVGRRGGDASRRRWSRSSRPRAPAGRSPPRAAPRSRWTPP